MTASKKGEFPDSAANRLPNIDYALPLAMGQMKCTSATSLAVAQFVANTLIKNTEMVPKQKLQMQAGT
jgi:hypothetical protein